RAVLGKCRWKNWLASVILTAAVGTGLAALPAEAHAAETVAAGDTANYPGAIFSNQTSITSGGALVNNGTATLSDSHFLNNSAQGEAYGGGEGGAILNNGTMTLSGNTVFTGNQAKRGAGICNYGTLTLLDGAAFSGNTAEYESAAVSNSMDMTVSGAEFRDNTVTDSNELYVNVGGGAVFNKGNASISSTLFDGNSAASLHGGALRNTGNLELTSVRFLNNTAKYGGGLSNENYANELKMVKGGFAGNKGTSGGGAVYVAAGSENVSFESTNFLGNNAGDRNHNYSNGGAILNNGAVYISGEVTFTGNTSTGMGGAISNEDPGSLLVLSGTTSFKSNQAGSTGSAIHNNGTVIAAGDTVLSGNTGGAAIFNQGTFIIEGSLTLGTATDSILNWKYDDLPGAIEVSGTLNLGPATLVNDGSLSFAAGSTLIVDAENYVAADSAFLAGEASENGPTAAIRMLEDGTLSIEKGAKLVVNNARADTTYVIVDMTEADTSSMDASNVWTEVETSSPMVSVALEFDPTSELEGYRSILLTTTASADAAMAFSGLSSESVGLVNSMYAGGLNDTESSAMGVRFLSRATDSLYLKNAGKAAAPTIESASRFSATGGVTQMARMTTDTAVTTLASRLGFGGGAEAPAAVNLHGGLTGASAGDETDASSASGFAMWLSPMWQNHNGHGFEAGSLDYGFSGNIGGIAIGADYTFENALRLGVSFNIGGGYTESNGDLAATTNNMTFWGVGLYGGWRYMNFGLMADVNYTSTWNSVEQELDPGLGMGNLEADIRSSAISAGLRGEYRFETGVLDITPHVGVRCMSLNTWGYDVEAAGGTVMESDGSQQSIWTFPVGISFSRDMAMSNAWYCKPSLDFTVIPAAGDIKSREDIRYTGLPATVEMESQTMDYFVWQGGAGVEFGNDHVKLGLNYTLQAGQHTTSHGLSGSLRWEF
ncbi:MAG: autotransporter domain-containing protein, partial [Desulfovibrionaceae bacterium]|nr:autotransporter domain-containing protein [Desulfovibrionaceae bacterium]